MASAGEEMMNHQAGSNSNQASAAVANANVFVSGSDNHNHHLNNVEMDEFERMLAGNSGQQMRQLQQPALARAVSTAPVIGANNQASSFLIGNASSAANAASGQ